MAEMGRNVRVANSGYKGISIYQGGGTSIILKLILDSIGIKNIVISDPDKYHGNTYECMSYKEALVDLLLIRNDIIGVKSILHNVDYTIGFEYAANNNLKILGIEEYLTVTKEKPMSTINDKDETVLEKELREINKRKTIVENKIKQELTGELFVKFDKLVVDESEVMIKIQALEQSLFESRNKLSSLLSVKVGIVTKLFITDTDYLYREIDDLTKDELIRELHVLTTYSGQIQQECMMSMSMSLMPEKQLKLNMVREKIELVNKLLNKLGA